RGRGCGGVPRAWRAGARRRVHGRRARLRRLRRARRRPLLGERAQVRWAERRRRPAGAPRVAGAAVRGGRGAGGGPPRRPRGAAPAMVGFGAASAERGNGDLLAAEGRAQRELTDRVALEAPARVGGVALYGDPLDRVPHLVCLGVEGVEAEPILLGLDQRGVAV